MTALGLNEQDTNLVLGVIAGHPEVTGAILFGSRAKGTASPSSDIDLAIEGVQDPLQTEKLASELDELPLPYTFDVLALASIASSDLRDHIARVGIRVYG